MRSGLYSDNSDGPPISRDTLYKYFKVEMANGRAMLKTKLVSGWHEAIDNGQAWAIQFGLRTVLGMWDYASVTLPQPEADGVGGRTISVTFVDAPPEPEPPQPKLIEHDPAPTLDLKPNAPSSGVPLVTPRRGPGGVGTSRNGATATASRGVGRQA